MDEEISLNTSSYFAEDSEGEAIEYIPELDLKLSDDELVAYINQKIQISSSHFEKELNLSERQKRNIEYYLGHQVDADMFEEWQVPYVNNVIFRNIETLLPIALNRIPDIVVIPANESFESKKFAENIKKILEKKIKSKQNRSVIRRALIHWILMFFGVIKYKWDERVGKSGDVCFENVLPENLVFDHTATKEEEMDFIAEKVKSTPREMIGEFPGSKEKILEMLNLTGENESQMMSSVKFWEVHFSIIDKSGKKVEAICWKYKDTIIHKQKTDNWDYEGVNLAGKGEEDLLSPEPVNMYYNHFDNPKKPYIFINFHSLGRNIIDDTNAVEQTISIQDNINKRGRQFTELADKANGKWAISSIAMSEENASLISDSPDEALYLTNPQNLPINNLIQRFPGQPPSPILYQDQQFNKQSADDMFSTHPSLRGTRETDVATTTLALQKSDTNRIADITQETIDKAVNEMANAFLQLIKVHATEEYMTKILGDDGQTTFISLTRDMIEDGMEVSVKSSLIDAAERRQMAQEEAKLGFTDPITYYEDMDRNNPKERAKRLVMWKMNRFEEYLDETVTDEARAIRDLFLLLQGKQPENPPITSQGYFRGVKTFVASKQFQTLSPQEKQIIIQYVQMLAQQQQQTESIAKPQEQRPRQAAASQQPLTKPSPSMFFGGQMAQQQKNMLQEGR